MIYRFYPQKTIIHVIRQPIAPVLLAGGKAAAKTLLPCTKRKPIFIGSLRDKQSRNLFCIYRSRQRRSFSPPVAVDFPLYLEPSLQHTHTAPKGNYCLIISCGLMVIEKRSKICILFPFLSPTDWNCSFHDRFFPPRRLCFVIP